jgi:hypothetical protein
LNWSRANCPSGRCSHFLFVLCLRAQDRERVRRVDSQPATTSRQSAASEHDHGFWRLRVRSLNVKRIAAARPIAANRRTAGAHTHGIERVENNKKLPMSAVAVGTGGWSL